MNTAKTRQAAAESTLTLPFRVPPKEWFTLRQAGGVLGISESMAEKLYDMGELSGHSHNAATGVRFHKRVLRSSLVAYAIKTADYTDDSLTDAYVAALAVLRDSTVNVTVPSGRLVRSR